MSKQQTTLQGTKYKKSVKVPTLNMLKPGKNNKKLGAFVRKGWWRGLPIFSLTLEERVTCPLSCEQWTNCYGNNMPFAHRFDSTQLAFKLKLARNLYELNKQHPGGFVVRLHVLGDFYSTNYVQMWARAMKFYNRLCVFGYTHHRVNSKIGSEIDKLNKLYPNRWRVRFSDDKSTLFRAEVVAKNQHLTSPGIICPEQLGKVKSCGDCGYCWHSDLPVHFLEH